MSEKFELYQAKIAEFRRAEERAQRVTHAVAVIQKQLSDWKRTMIIGNGLSGYPPELALHTKTPTIRAEDWPSVTEIHEALTGYHRARQELQIAYDSIPIDNRNGVQTPESVINPPRQYSR